MYTHPRVYVSVSATAFRRIESLGALSVRERTRAHKYTYPV